MTTRCARKVPCAGPGCDSRSRTHDLQLRRSFRATPPPARAQVGRAAASPPVSLNDPSCRHDLARMWHEALPGAANCQLLTHRKPGPCADAVRMTEVGVGLHGRSVCQQVLTVSGACTHLFEGVVLLHRHGMALTGHPPM